MKHTRFPMLVAIVTVSLALLSGRALAQEAKQFSTTKPVPRDANWLARHKAMNERVKQGNVDLLMIGDSITDMWSNRGKEVWTKYYGKRNAVNLGIGGDKTENVLWRLQNGNIDGIKPKLAVVMIGTNNVGSGAKQIAAGVQAIVETLRTKLPETKVLLLAIFPRDAEAKSGRRVELRRSMRSSPSWPTTRMFSSSISARNSSPTTARCPRTSCPTSCIPARRDTRSGRKPWSPRSKSSWASKRAPRKIGCAGRNGPLGSRL